MNKIIILFMVLATAFSLQAKKVEIGMHETNHSQLCEVFSEKVNRLSEQTSSNKNSELVKEFMSRKKEHCSK